MNMTNKNKLSIFYNQYELFKIIILHNKGRLCSHDNDI